MTCDPAYQYKMSNQHIGWHLAAIFTNCSSYELVMELLSWTLIMRGWLPDIAKEVTTCEQIWCPSHLVCLIGERAKLTLGVEWEQIQPASGAVHTFSSSVIWKNWSSVVRWVQKVRTTCTSKFEDSAGYHASCWRAPNRYVPRDLVPRQGQWWAMNAWAIQCHPARVVGKGLLSICTSLGTLRQMNQANWQWTTL